jgi:hypothetical protein
LGELQKSNIDAQHQDVTLARAASKHMLMEERRAGWTEAVLRALLSSFAPLAPAQTKSIREETIRKTEQQINAT